MNVDINNGTLKKIDISETRDMILGLNAKVKLKNGKEVQAINLDNAATTPPFKDVADEIGEQLNYYGSIGRGMGQKSDLSTQNYINGRDKIKKFLGADDEKYEVIYVNCTTDGMNKLASALIESPRDRILATRMEHHANDLPWRERARTVYIDVDNDGRLLAENYEAVLMDYAGSIKYVVVTAASNVTGYVNDVHAIAKIAHKYGARIVVDGAQIVAHREFSMICKDRTAGDDIDFFVFSAHKMYSPYGGGALVGLKDELDEQLPVFYGGGMVNNVYDDYVEYSRSPDRYEAGSPNYPGVVGLLKAIDILKHVGFDQIREHEQMLLKRAIDGLKRISEVILYGDDCRIEDRVGILVFNIRGMKNDILAKMLADDYAIAVRHAKFCAHTYVQRLLNTRASIDTACANDGMVRVSFGIYTDLSEVDAFIAAVENIVKTTDTAMLIAETSSANAQEYKPNDRG